jgi:shikimate dehydrogenase
MRAAVLGHPVAHSLSPLLHNTAYGALGLEGWRYDRVDVSEDRFADFVHCLGSEWAGLSLTMPLKVVGAQSAHTCSEIVSRTGVANTLVLRDGRLHADNTDVAGVLGALSEARGASATKIETAVVIGAGATARSAAVALESFGARTLVVMVRRTGSARQIQEICPALTVIECPMDSQARPHFQAADVVVSTVPMSASDAVAAELPPDVRGCLLDVLYEPWPTPLAQAWRARGGQVISGARMLLHQAAPQVELMTGRSVTADVRASMSTALESTPR